MDEIKSESQGTSAAVEPRAVDFTDDLMGDCFFFGARRRVAPGAARVCEQRRHSARERARAGALRSRSRAHEHTHAHARTRAHLAVYSRARVGVLLRARTHSRAAHVRAARASPPWACAGS